MNYPHAKSNIIKSSNLNTRDIFSVYCAFCTKFAYFTLKILKRPMPAGALPDSLSVAPPYHNINKGKFLIC